MPVHITRISMQGCGPVKDMEADLSPLTLVYAGNERGKTTLVENMLASLFKDQKDGMYPGVRGDSFIGRSQVTVSIDGNKPETFTPGNRKKTLDEILEKGGVSLPKSLFNLLFVRGAQLEIVPGYGGIDRRAIKNLLSRQYVYDAILDRLEPEIHYTKIEDGRIKPDRKNGKYYKMYDNTDALKKAEDLSREFHNTLSQTRMVKLNNRLKNLTERMKKMDQAKRYHAFLLKKESDRLQASLSSMNEQEIDRLEDAIREYSRLKSQVGDMSSRLKKFGSLEHDIRWLEEAEREYQQCLSRSYNRWQVVFLVITMVAMLSAILSFYFLPKMLFPFLGISCISLLLALMFSFVFRGEFTPAAARTTMENIEKDFNARYGKPLASVADFRALRSGLEQKAGQKQELEESARLARENARALESEIPLRMASLNADEVSLGKAPVILQQRKQQVQKEKHRLAECSSQLQMLNVPENEYSRQPADETYSPAAEASIRKEIEQCREDLEKERQGFEILLRKLSDVVGSDTAHSGSLEAISEKLDEVITQLYRERSEAYAEIVAGVAVRDVIADFQKEEDSQIEEYMNDPSITRSLEKLTGRYTNIYLDGDSIRVGDGTISYPLEEVSTGAREQVLMALRVGMATRISGADSLFLLLDDAFQYSDWTRRQNLVDQSVALVKDGWQVIYLTMDDDIRDRFLEAGETMSEKFTMITL